MKNLKLLMEQSGMNTRDLAELLNVSPQAIGKWIRGDGMPRSDKLIQLSDALHCTIDMLFGRENVSA